MIITENSYFEIGLKEVLKNGFLPSNLNIKYFYTGHGSVYVFFPDKIKPNLFVEPIQIFAICRKNKISMNLNTNDFANELMEVIGNSHFIPKPPLTMRELLVLDNLGKGMSSKSISKFLNIEEKTISSHKNNALNKLSMESFSSFHMEFRSWCKLWFKFKFRFK